MFKMIMDKIKNWGIGHAIDALDNLEGPLGDKLDLQQKRLEKFDSHQFAKWIVDEVQEWLRAYFKIPQPQPTNEQTQSTNT